MNLERNHQSCCVRLGEAALPACERQVHLEDDVAQLSHEQSHWSCCVRLEEAVPTISEHFVAQLSPGRVNSCFFVSLGVEAVVPLEADLGLDGYQLDFRVQLSLELLQFERLA